jgi:hypothetical protein
MKVQGGRERAHLARNETCTRERMAHDPDDLPPGEDRRNGRAWAIAIGMLLAFGVGVFVYPELVNRLPIRNEDPGSSRSGAALVGTSGREPIAGADDRSGSPPPPSIIRELETITGMNDGHELIGRKVFLHVPIAQHINDGAFWIGAADNRLLVVRDDRNGADGQRGLPSSAGGPVTVTGTVQALPRADVVSGWGLTDRDRDELRQRKIYIQGE